MAHRILLADDSITIQKVVNLTFSDEGIDVVTVGNGDLALKKLREETFDLVLADIFMPGTDGYRLCEYVKTQPELAHVPVILLVGAFEPFDRSEAARVRADGHLTKPFESRVLVETVRKMLAQAAPKATEAPAPAPPSGWDVPPVSESAAEEAEPEPPPYDPYASTAKLPPISQVLRPEDQMTQAMGSQEPTQSTMVIGSPFASPEPPAVPEPSWSGDAPRDAESRPEPTGDLFQLDVSTPFVIGAEPSPGGSAEQPLSLDTQQNALFGAPPEPQPIAFEPVAPEPQVSFEPPPPVAEPPIGFEETPAPRPVEPAPAPSPIGYQPGSLGESPLELDDIGTIETHMQAGADVLEVRDPLLDTFEDVKESTATVDAQTDPGLVTNAQPEVASELEVRPVEGLVSGWETEPGAWDSNRTQAYAPVSAPYEAAEQIAPDAPSADETPTFDPNRTQVYSIDARPYEAATPEPTVAEAPTGEPAPAPEAEVAHDEAYAAAPPPETEVAPAEGPEPSAAVHAAGSNGAAAHHGDTLLAIPSDLIDEVVRRTVERMSDDVIREIAWEVVPDLAEALIRKHLADRQ